MAKKKAESKAIVPLYEVEQFEELVRYEPHPRKPNKVREDKPYLFIDLVIDTEGLEDLGEGDVLLNFPQVKLLQKMSMEFDEGNEVEGAKPGMFWHVANMAPVPEGTELVPLYAYKITYKRDDPQNPTQDVFHIVFVTYEFIQNYNEWLTRCLDEDDLEIGMEILNNMFALPFTAMGNKVYKDLQSAALTQGGLYSRVVKLGKAAGKNDKGTWWEPRFPAIKRLTENEVVVARSLKELCRTVWNQIEKFYNRRNTLPDDYNETENQGSESTVD